MRVLKRQIKRTSCFCLFSFQSSFYSSRFGEKNHVMAFLGKRSSSTSSSSSQGWLLRSQTQSWTNFSCLKVGWPQRLGWTMKADCNWTKLLLLCLKITLQGYSFTQVVFHRRICHPISSEIWHFLFLWNAVVWRSIGAEFGKLETFLSFCKATIHHTLSQNLQLIWMKFYERRHWLAR